MFSLVLDEEIAQELCLFKQGKAQNLSEIQKILQYYKPNPLFPTKELLVQYYDGSLATPLLSTYSNLYHNNPSPQELIHETTYKIILTLKQDGFPYVNINNSKIQNQITSTFTKEEKRDNALLHFEALLENATQIFIYDRYLEKPNIQNALLSFINQCFPKKPLTIYTYQKPIDFQSLASKIKKSHKDWHIKQADHSQCQSFSGLHDRYIIIDQKIQIILTSGIEHLIDEKKDFTYLIKPHKTS